MELLISPTQTKSFPVSFTSIYGTINHSVGPSHMPYLIYHQVLLAVICKRIILNLITFSHLYYCSYSSHDHSSPRLPLPRSPPCLTLCSTPTSYSRNRLILVKSKSEQSIISPAQNPVTQDPWLTTTWDFISYHCLCSLSSTLSSLTLVLSQREANLISPLGLLDLWTLLLGTLSPQIFAWLSHTSLRSLIRLLP